MSITTEEAERLANMVEDQCNLSSPAIGLRSLAAERDKAQGYLSRCLQSLYPNIEPLPDLLGVCTQIDNVLAGQKVENARLREALRLAIDAVKFWAAYAPPYFQDKHDLAEDLQKLRATLGETQ
jgi:hypothetical protein